MTTLAHISDLHFGRDEPAMAEALLQSLRDLAPDVIVISGDFTQRAKKRQFRAAKAFLDRLPDVPRLVVPGNHDVSTTNLFERAVHPLRRYIRFITPNLAPFVSLPGVAIAGINTVRVVARKDGRINTAQIAEACRQLSGAAPDAIRVIVTHHPMDLPATDTKHALVTRAKPAMKAFAACGVDLYLSGHLHSGLALTSAARYGGRAAVVVHAGTAISTRTRKEPNGWNILRVSPTAIEIDRMEWGLDSFVPGQRVAFKPSKAGWVAA